MTLTDNYRANIDSTSNSTIILDNTEINGQKVSSSDINHDVIFSEISIKTDSKIFNKIDINGALLLLFPPVPPKDYVMPTIEEIVVKLQELLDLGFNLSNAVILDILQLFEKRLNSIGEKVIRSFISIRKNEGRDEFYKNIVAEAIKSERNTKVEVLNFLEKIIGNKSKTIFMDAMKVFKGKHQFYSIDQTSTIDEFQSVKSTPCYKPLLFNIAFYNFVLIKFTEYSEIAQFAFNDIFETIISFDLYQNSKEFSNCKFLEAKFNEANNIFKIYCNARNFFLVSHLELLKKVSREDILCPLFEFYLLDLFDLPTTFKMPMEITDDANIYFKPKRKRKKRSITKVQRLEWLTAIENIYKDIIKKGDFITLAMSPKFRKCVEDLYYELKGEEIFEELQMELEMNDSIKKYKINENT
ncbi:33916_t:CDS:2 [Gigaspora margarita]|uniref:33916_t:CDS:1 n=1 Tax=Gigaspora margarita TaxID=4874 RepID=A0ABN7UGR9_GIGMA|nr:33916_t:CDS:2 [Gigaspora margarita]